MENIITVTVNCTPLSTFTKEDRTYAICLLASPRWPYTRLQAFRFDDSSIWTEDFRPDKHCSVKIHFSDLPEGSDGAGRIDWRWLTEHHPHLFPNQGTALSFSSNPYRAIEKSYENIKRYATRVLIQSFNQHKDEEVVELRKLFHQPILQVLTDCYEHMSHTAPGSRPQSWSGENGLAIDLAKRPIVQRHVALKPLVGDEFPELPFAGKSFTAEYIFEIMMKDGLYVLDTRIVLYEIKKGQRRPLLDRFHELADYVIQYQTKPGQSNRIKDILAGGAPYSLTKKESTTLNS